MLPLACSAGRGVGIGLGKLLAEAQLAFWGGEEGATRSCLAAAFGACGQLRDRTAQRDRLPPRVDREGTFAPEGKGTGAFGATLGGPEKSWLNGQAPHCLLNGRWVLTGVSLVGRTENAGPGPYGQATALCCPHLGKGCNSLQGSLGGTWLGQAWRVPCNQGHSQLSCLLVFFSSRTPWAVFRMNRCPCPGRRLRMPTETEALTGRLDQGARQVRGGPRVDIH